MTKPVIVLGITGGIAAYKTPDLIRDIRREGYDVEVVMTRSAQEFITPLTLREVSGHPVHTGMFDPIIHFDVEHIALARKASLVAVVPATANMIGKYASGIADDLLSTVLLATTAPVLMAPAMNTGMYINPVVQENIAKLKQRGVHFVGPAKGTLLCGDEGEGRLSPLPEIVEMIHGILTPKDMSGMKVLVTAGPTQEPWDPVRFISNHSSGKMGYALARNAVRRGASVRLISGPTELPEVAGVEMIRVKTTLEMYQAVMEHFPSTAAVVMAAAPTDYTPRQHHVEKIKRTGEDLTIELVENPDIAAAVGMNKGEALLVAFAAETQNIKENARKKLFSKKADLVVANSLVREGSGFRGDTNQASLITSSEEIDLPLMGKDQLAAEIWNAVLHLREHQSLSALNP